MDDSSKITGVDISEPMLTLANELKAEKDYTRLARLHREDPGTISVRRLEVSQASLDQARAKVSAAEAGIQQAIEQKE